MLNTPIQDKTINRQVQGKIAGRGLVSPCRIMVATLKGEVTLSGTVQHAQQKSTAVQAAMTIAGVRRVVDRLIVKPAARY
jgi:osmotically-inducible protein OsmY